MARRTSGDTSRRIARHAWALAESLSGGSLKLGIIVFVITAGYLLYGIFSGGVAGFTTLGLEDKKRLFETASIAATAVRISAAVVVSCLILLYYQEDVVGYIFGALGALGYFVGPSGIYSFVGAAKVNGNPLAAVIITAFQTVSLIFFVPGVALTARALIMNLFDNITGKMHDDDSGIIWTNQEDEEAEKQEKKGTVIYPKCWETGHCRSFIRKHCPAYRQRKNCWRIRSGCYCDESMILQALTVKRHSALWEQDKYQEPGTKKAKELPASVKRQRCRKCSIYVEHQRRKYQILSPLVFPLVIFMFWTYFGQITRSIQYALKLADQIARFVSFSTTHHTATTVAVGNSDSLFVTLFIIWLGIIAVSYILRGLEYCIFKLQI